MDEAHVTITIKPIHLERLAYWIVILGLAVLLILAFLRDDSCPAGTDGITAGTQPAAPAAGAQPAQPTTPAPAAAAASCLDAKKNQDETDIDCGGAACAACVAGKACRANADCVSGACNAGVCGAPAPSLSGTLAFDVSKAYTVKSPTGTAKVTGIDYKVTNGLGQDLNGFVVKVFIKNKAGTRCLNQATAGTCEETYAEFSGPTVRSGKDGGGTHMFSDEEYTTTQGRYLIEDNGYDPTDSSLDDVQVIAYLYDSAGEQIGGRQLSDSVAVSP